MRYQVIKIKNSLFFSITVMIFCITSSIIVSDNIQAKSKYKINYKLKDNWIKSQEIKNEGIEELILRNGIPFGHESYEASITIVHRIIPNITVRQFAESDHENMINYFKKQNINVQYFNKWDPYENVKGREKLSYMSIYYGLKHEKVITYIKMLYIHVGDDFYIITFNSVKEEYISDIEISFFLDSLEFIYIMEFK